MPNIAEFATFLHHLVCHFRIREIKILPTTRTILIARCCIHFGTEVDYHDSDLPKSFFVWCLSN